MHNIEEKIIFIHLNGGTMDQFRYIKTFLKKHAHRYVLGILLLIGIDLLQLITPIIIGNFTDQLLNETLTREIIFRYITYILLIATGVAVGRFAWRILIIGSSKKMEYWLRNQLFGHLEKMSLHYFNHNKTGDLMAHATNDINTIRMAFGPGIIMITDAVFMTTMTLILMITRINLKLTLIALLPLPLITLFVGGMGFVIRKRFKGVQEAFSNLTDKVQESFSGIRVIKTFVQEEAEIESFQKYNQENMNAEMNLIKVWGVMFPLVGLISSVSLILALLFGGILVIDETLTAGMFVTFITYIGMLTWPMMAVGWVINVLQRGMVSLGRINEILDTEPDIVDKENVVNPDDLKASLEVKNLNFTYPGTNIEVLKDVSFKIEEGQTLAVVGRTGAGKTTLVNLLLKLYEVDDNMIYFGGHQMNDLPVQVIRDAIGYVPQDNFLFSKTIEENIQFAQPDISDEDLLHVTKISNMHQEILGFDQGYDTLLGEKGVNLSGGQKQRLSISRALAKKPKMLFLDDSLSAVDTLTEEKILGFLKEEMKETTSIIIAHRISTIKDADLIIVLDDGAIVERGNHKSLVEENGIYADMYNKQLLEEKISKE